MKKTQKVITKQKLENYRNDVEWIILSFLVKSIIGIIICFVIWIDVEFLIIPSSISSSKLSY